MFSTYTESASAQHRASLAAAAQRARMARQAGATHSGTGKPRPVRGAGVGRTSRFPRLVLPRIAVAH